MGPSVRLTGVLFALALLAAFAPVAAATEVVLWQNANTSFDLGGNFSYVRVNGSGVETASNRCADDFVLPDLNGTGAPVVITQINTDLIAQGSITDGDEAIAEVWTDSGGEPGTRLFQFGAGRRISLVLDQNGLQWWSFRFEALAAPLQPGVRYWLVVAMRTPSTSTQFYYRRRTQGVVGLNAHRIESDGDTPVKGFDVTQEMRGYQVSACPPFAVQGTLLSGSSNHEATAAIIQIDRIVRDGTPTQCGFLHACSVIDDDDLRSGTIHSFWNDSGVSACIEVTLEQPCGVNGAYAVAYGTTYDTGNLCRNQAGDSGASTAVQKFSFDVFPGQVFHLVVHAVDSAPGCQYTLWVQGLPRCCDYCPGDANRDGVVDFNDLSEVLGLWLNGYGGVTGPGDANCDAFVDFGDIVEVLGNWLADCVVPE